MIPDFVDINGGKVAIEMFGTYWHSGGREHMSVEERERRFASLGWKLIIIWDYELKNPEEVVRKIRQCLGS